MPIVLTGTPATATTGDLINGAMRLIGMLAEGDGKLSNKRVITLLSTLMLVVAFVANLFFNYKIDDNILNAIMFVIIGGMGITGMEKFAPKITAPIKK